MRERSLADHVSYNLRRAQQERRKAAEARSEIVRQGRLELAALFEARAEAMAVPEWAVAATLH